MQAYRDHLRYATVLPVHWQVRDAAESTLVKTRRHRRNVAALAIDAASDERRADDAASSPEIVRIETKLNAVIELFATLIERDLVLPPSTTLRLNAHGIEWKTAEAPTPDLDILVRVHLDACPALPLELAARTVSPLEEGWAAAGFDALKTPLPETIEKLVFREHRRQLADSIGADK